MLIQMCKSCMDHASVVHCVSACGRAMCVKKTEGQEPCIVPGTLAGPTDFVCPKCALKKKEGLKVSVPQMNLAPLLRLTSPSMRFKRTRQRSFTGLGTWTHSCLFTSRGALISHTCRTQYYGLHFKRNIMTRKRCVY